MSGMTKYNQRENSVAEEALGEAIVNNLMRGENVIIPDFGYLELKSLSDKRTVLFKSGDRLSAKLAVDEKNGLQSTINDLISAPLKEGKVVTLSKLGVFRPIKAAEGFRLSFTPSLSLRKRLNGEEDIVEVKVNERSSSDEVVDININKEKNDPAPKPKTGTGKKTAQVGDVIIPQDDVSVSSKKMRNRARNRAGWLVAAVAVLAIGYIVWTSFFSKNNTEEQPLPVATQQSNKVNLPALSEQHYGNPIFWVYIYEANQDKLTSPINVPAGISLVIPDLEEEYAVDISDSLEIHRANSRAESILKQLK